MRISPSAAEINFFIGNLRIGRDACAMPAQRSSEARGVKSS
jgi:hypothetical protein